MKIIELAEALSLIHERINIAHKHESDECFIVGQIELNGADWKRGKIKSATAAGEHSCGCPKGVLLTLEY